MASVYTVRDRLLARWIKSAQEPAFERLVNKIELFLGEDLD